MMALTYDGIGQVHLQRDSRHLNILDSLDRSDANTPCIGDQGFLIVQNEEEDPDRERVFSNGHNC